MELLGNEVLVIVISQRWVTWESIVPSFGEFFKQEGVRSELVF